MSYEKDSEESSLICSVQFSHSVVSKSLQPHELQHARLPCPSPSPRACSNSCPLSQRCHPIISSSVVPFSFCLQSFPASGSFPIKNSRNRKMFFFLVMRSLRIYFLNHFHRSHITMLIISLMLYATSWYVFIL